MASESLAYRGRVIGFLLMVLGAWGALVPFVGPYFGYAYTPDQVWVYTSGRLWLSILPGAAVFLGGLLLLVLQLVRAQVTNLVQFHLVFSSGPLSTGEPFIIYFSALHHPVPRSSRCLLFRRHRHHHVVTHHEAGLQGKLV